MRDLDRNYNQGILLFIDLKKAFDSEDHLILE
jgi:hypothetical protein